MGMLGRAFAGFGAGVSSLAQRYMNEEDAANRARLMADLQHQNMVKADQYQNDPARRALLREQGALDTESASAATAKGTRAATVAAAGDADYQAAQDLLSQTDAERKAKGEVTGGMIKAPFLREQKQLDAQSDAATARDITKANAADKDYLAAQSKIALADPKTAAQISASRAAAAAAFANAEQSREQTAGIKLANDDKKRLGSLYDKLTSTLYDDGLTDDARAKEMQKLNTQIQAIKAKNGMAAARDPELDTVTVKRTATDEKGNITETTEKRVRRPGSEGGGEEAPYADGTELRGKDGNIYVVQNGRPVLKNAPAKQTSKPSAPPAPPAKPQGDYASFEAMEDDELARYVRAGNAIAIEVAKERQAKASRSPAQTYGAEPGI